MVVTSASNSLHFPPFVQTHIYLLSHPHTKRMPLNVINFAAAIFAGTSKVPFHLDCNFLRFHCKAIECRIDLISHSRGVKKALTDLAIHKTLEEAEKESISFSMGNCKMVTTVKRITQIRDEMSSTGMRIKTKESSASHS